MNLWGHHFDWFDITGAIATFFVCFVWPWIATWIVANVPRPMFPLWKRLLFDITVDVPAIRAAQGMVGAWGTKWNLPGAPSRHIEHNPPASLAPPKDLPSPITDADIIVTPQPPKPPGSNL